MIPTYMNEDIMYWFAENKEEADKYNIGISSPASNCSIELYNDAMAAYRVEF